MPGTEVALPIHNDGCFGCGPANAAAVGIVFHQLGDRVVGTLTLDERYRGAPGLAHGGVVSAVLDEAAGTLTFAMRQPAVTAQLNVAFRQPVPLNRQLVVTGRLDRREGERKLHIKTTLELDGTVVAEADALFIVVGPEHFHANGAAPGAIPRFGV